MQSSTVFYLHFVIFLFLPIGSHSLPSGDPVWPVSRAPSSSVSPYFFHLLSAYVGQVGGAFEGNDSRGREQSKEGKKAKDDKAWTQDHIQVERRED